MKKIVLLLLCVGMMAFSAQAKTVGPESSWEEIKASGLIPGFSSIFFDGIGVTVDSLCVDGEYLRPVNPYLTYCVEYNTSGDRFECVKTEVRYARTPIQHEEEICSVWDTNSKDAPNCLKYEKVTVEYPLNYKVPVYKVSPRAGHVQQFVKDFTIPRCQ